MSRVAGATTAVLLLLVACGGGGGGGGSPTQPPAPAGIVFSPASAQASNAIVLAEAAGGSTTRLRLDVKALQMNGMFGVAFDLVYPSGALQYVSATQGGFLTPGQTSLQVVESSPGRLVIGDTRLGSQGGVSGSGVILTLDFDAVAGGSGSFTFEKSAAFAAGGKEIADTQFAGGSVTVTR